MLEEMHSAPAGGRGAAGRRTILILSLLALLLLAVAQFASYAEGGWNPGLIVLATLIVTHLAWRYRRRA